MDRTVLVVGANGRLGRAAVRAFSEAGWRVIAQARRAPTVDGAGVVPLTTPLEDTATLARQAAGARVLVHAVNPVYTHWQTEALPAARASMDLARRLDATFMLPGNVYNFGERMPALLSEDTPQAPTTRKGRIRCEIEAELTARAADGLDSMVIRAGDFYGGSGAGTWIDLVIARSLASGRLVQPGPPDVPHAWAYLPDLARAFVAVAARCADALEAAGRAQARRLHFAGHTLTGAQMLDAIERAAIDLGLAPAGGLRRSAMPWWVFRLASPFVPMWREVLEMAYLWRVPHALSGDALARFAGPLPATPVDVAVRQALVDLGFADGARR